MAVQLVEVPKIVVGLAVSSGEDGSSGPGKRDTTDAAAAAVEVLVGEARPLLGSHSTVQRQNPKSKSLPVKLGHLALEQTTRLAVSMQKLLVKLGLLGSPSTVSRQRQSRVNECNSALPSKLRMRFNIPRRPSRR